MTIHDPGKSMRIGKSYERHAAAYVESLGYEIIGTNIEHASGVQFDIHARNILGMEIGIECKAGDENSDRPGMRRSDNVWKVGGYLFQLHNWATLNPTETAPRYVVVTTNMPDQDTKWGRMCYQWQLQGHVEFMVLDYPTEAAT
jgi:hypothetical protein